jgi:murein DD-endopeptidase MepM/ murein hydrolase activator NlpD
VPPPPSTTVAPAPRRAPRAYRTTRVRRSRPAAHRPARIRAATLESSSLSLRQRCLLVGAIGVLAPGERLRVLGPFARAASGQRVGAGRAAYPADGTIATASAIDVRTSGCGRGGAASGRALIRSLSLFGGAVTARRVELDTRGVSVLATSGLTGLAVSGKAVAAARGRRVPVGDWGQALLLPAPAAVPGAPRLFRASVLSIRLDRPRGGLRPGTVVLVGLALAPRVKRPAHAKAKGSRPLKVTPPLGLPRYVFPVAGDASYGDSYGGPRGDVPGNWHHGDDIFAKLGTPVVAVASGTLNRVGWERLGGWRLWVRDSLGNEFYYAHLSGYSPLALHSNRVEAGEVIGFVGNTGDAFTTPPHLHFEIHPRSLLHLQYDGAVDPTTYLDHWRHLERVRAPRPAHPGFPRGAVRREAAYVWGELLAARGLARRAPKPSERPKTVPSSPDGGRSPNPRAAIAALAPARAAITLAPAPPPRPAGAGGPGVLLLGLLAAAGALLLAAAGLTALRPSWLGAVAVAAEPPAQRLRAVFRRLQP